MRILISNDDGIHAPGILALAKEMAKIGEVVVVAPTEQRSASSHGISLHNPLYVNSVDLHIPNVVAYEVSGTPVDCVKWGIVYLNNPPFDVMVSGINEGPNLATDVLYSGTIAAAGEASLQRIPAYALSLTGPDYDYEAAATVTRELVLFFKDKPLPSDTFMSVNFPVNMENAPWHVTELGARGYKSDFIKAVDQAGHTYYRHSAEALEELGGEDTDVIAIEQGHISLTPLRYRFTNSDFLDSLKSWVSERQ
jgi:5'-nucleotidase